MNLSASKLPACRVRPAASLPGLLLRRLRRLPWLALLLPVLSLPAATSPRTIPITECAPLPTDFTSLSWSDGWLDGKPRDPAHLWIETGTYTAVIDPWKPALVRFGRPWMPPVPPTATGLQRDRRPWLSGLPALPPTNGPAWTAPDYEGFAGTDPRDLDDHARRLARADLELLVEHEGTTYRCVRAAGQRSDVMNYPVRLIEGGRHVQRFDILQLEFADATGRPLRAEGRLEGIAWAEELRLLLQVDTPSDLGPVTLAMRARTGDTVGALRSVSQSSRTEGGRVIWSALLRLPAPGGGRGDAAIPTLSRAGSPAIAVGVVDRRDGTACEVRSETAPGWHRILLPARRWSVADEPDRLERIQVSLTNDTPSEQVVRLLIDDPTGTPAITGLTPMLRTLDGTPTGIPFQTSKNWHRQPDRRLLYEGPWLHAFTVLRLPPRSRTEAEVTLAFARWGGVPAASHAQLCLVGWGWNQLWDEAAIGSWGETICYEPEAIQRRCRIDDLRPLLVTGMGANRPRWTWTHNVGGGDFLVLFDSAGRYQPWRAVRTAYLSQGPNLTHVRYSGLTADGSIACRVEVLLPRTDDLTRVYHRLRYDVLEPVTFSRLAFHQLGADRYHGHQFQRMARGTVAGLDEEWDPGKGGRHYLRTGITPGTPADAGSHPWFSLHDAIPADSGKRVDGAWATRGVVLRSWKARLGGRPAPPTFAVYGTQDGGIPSANLELSAPEGLTRLERGDFLEADLEVLVLPHQAEDYYGPNASLKTSLATDANTWRGMHRQARGNALRLTAVRGRVVDRFLPRIEVDSRQRAEVEITGGLGWVPLTLQGVASPGGWQLEMDTGDGWRRVDQSVHGRDFWQASMAPERRAWDLTFNLPLDPPREPNPGSRSHASGLFRSPFARDARSPSCRKAGPRTPRLRPGPCVHASLRRGTNALDSGGPPVDSCA